MKASSITDLNGFVYRSSTQFLFSVDQESPGSYSSAFTDVGRSTPRDRRATTDKEVVQQ